MSTSTRKKHNTGKASLKAYVPPCKICVCKKRKQIIVLDWGQEPFHRHAGKDSWVPHGFSAHTVLLNTKFTANTRVVGSEALYQFTTEEVAGDFCKTPTNALQNVADKLGEAFLKKFRRGTNGSLHIGVFGDAVQRAIRTIHEHSLPSLSEDENMQIGVEALLALKC
ncbi:hypothetical protein BASA81_008069 [Batrachochytrium salamandrivorans]|nr:hypothetical protein BASA81_008069 [Batrachochytrium salamandrivorans]